MRAVARWIISVSIVVSALLASPADAATDPLCEHFRDCPVSAGEFTLTPSPKAMNVAWAVTAPATAVCWKSESNGVLDWDNCALVGYKVTSTLDPVTNTGGQACVTVDLAHPNCTFTGLVNGVQYKYSVQAVYGIHGSTPLDQQLVNRCFIGSGAGGNDCVYDEGRVNAPISGPSPSKAPCCDLPLAPTDVTATVLRNSADISWSAPSNWGGAPELTYTVTTLPADTTCTTVGLTCRLDGLHYGKTYAVSVTASNSAGSSPAAGTAANIPIGPPEAPTVTRVTYLPGGRARISWSAPASNGGAPITQYSVSSNPGKRTCTTRGSATQCEISGLTGGRGYAFTAAAANGKGTGAPSAPKAAGVLVGPASKPRNVAAALNGTTATVSWAPPTSNGGGKVLFYVVQSTPSGLTCNATKTSCTLPGLARGRSYVFNVYAVNTSGRGQAAASNAVLAPVPIAVAPPVSPPKTEAPIS